MKRVETPILRIDGSTATVRIGDACTSQSLHRFSSPWATGLPRDGGRLHWSAWQPRVTPVAPDGNRARRAHRWHAHPVGCCCIRAMYTACSSTLPDSCQAARADCRGTPHSSNPSGIGCPSDTGCVIGDGEWAKRTRGGMELTCAVISMSMGVDHCVGRGQPACRIGGIPNNRLGNGPS